MDKKIIVILSLFLIILSTISVYSYLTKDIVDIKIKGESMEKLNKLFKETDKNKEFVGYIDNEGDFGLLGYKSLVNNDIDIINMNIEETNISIHSHPKSNFCYPSERDSLSQEGVICIMCDIDKVRCFENE